MTATTAIWSPVSTAVSMSGGGIPPGLYQQAGARQYRCPQRPVQASSAAGPSLDRSWSAPACPSPPSPPPRSHPPSQPPPSARSPMACSLTVDGAIAPNWVLGLACGAGGLTGGYLGARLKPRMPETVLRAAAGRARDRPGPGMCRRGGALHGHRGGAPVRGRTTLLSCPPKVRRRTRSRWRSWPRRRWRSGRRPVRRECSRR
jgi:hypothetical protein